MSGNDYDETGGHGGDLARALKEWNPAGGDFLDFSSNINPLGPPPGLIEHLSTILPEIVSYPTPQARVLREKLAVFLDLPVERLIVGNGANELIHLLILWRRPGRVLIPAPAFSEYERAAVLAKAVVERFHLPPGKEFEPQTLIDKIREGDLLVFCNPNNPTGKLYRRSELLPVIQAAGQKGADVMVDESFMLLTGCPEESLRNLQGGHLWVVISLTKLWALPGLRLGCAVGPAKEVAEITGWGDPWRVNNIAQEAGIYCLDFPGYLKKSLALFENERRFLAKKFQETGAFHVYEGSANFLLLRGLDPSFEVASFQADLAKRGVLIRRADTFCGLDRRHFRVAVRRRDENLRLLKETKAWLARSSAKKTDRASRRDLF